MAKESSKSAKESFTNTRRVKELLDLMRDNELVEIELVEDKAKIILRRANPYGAAHSAPPVHHHGSPGPLAPHAVAPAGMSPAPNPPEEDKLVPIKSPMVGTFYSKATPESDSYVVIGSQVTEDETVVCVIEAMKVFNEIRADASGTIAKVLVQNGQAVEFNQALFLVKPN